MKNTLTKPKRRKQADRSAARHKQVGKGVKKTNDIAGVVTNCIQGTSGSTQPMSAAKLIHSLKAGLPVCELEALHSNLDLPMERLVPMLGISKATYHRRKLAGRLDVAESERVVRFARLLGKASFVMGSVENGRLWLTSAQVGLNGEIPLEYAETEVGSREVENLLGRIDYGVYS